jgi:hypothetical protein
LRPRSALSAAAALPGGDPLAALLAAGETPSPEMIAATGGTHGLRPAVAIACLASVVVCMILVIRPKQAVNEGLAAKLTGKPVADVVWLAMWPIMLGLAWYHLRRGRVDRRILFRASVYILFLGVLVWLLSADHVAGHLENDVLSLGLASCFFYVVFFALWYSAIEPLVRRTWPHSLITWTRLWHGRLRDPLIGRDVLLGMLAGTSRLLVVHTVNLISARLAGESPFTHHTPPEMLETATVLSSLLDLQVLGLVICCFCIATVLLARVVVRSNAGAVLLYVAFVVAVLGPWNDLGSIVRAQFPPFRDLVRVGQAGSSSMRSRIALDQRCSWTAKTHQNVVLARRAGRGRERFLQRMTRLHTARSILRSRRRAGPC